MCLRSIAGDVLSAGKLTEHLAATKMVAFLVPPSHLVSFDEIQPLLSPDVEVLVIGIGWHSAVGVDPAIEELEGIELHILPTPDAFDLFNRYVSAGRRVALIAHSTC